MYGLLHSANRRLAHLAAAPYSERFLRAFSSTARIDDLVYVGKGYKVCGKDEIESEISESYTHCRRKLNNERKVLPPELHSRNVARLTCDSTAAGGICDVYLVGSAHDCPKSWREVQNVISFLKPEVVFLELCSRRLDILKGQQLKVPTMREMFELWKNNEDPFWILYLWFYLKCSYQQECSEHDEWFSGEFGVAYKEAMKYGGKVILGDRPIHITVRREYAALSPWISLYELEYCLSVEDFPEMAKDDIEYVKLVAEEVRKKLSTHTEVIVGERDQYMSAKILEVAGEHKSVVTVVGREHLPGIQEYWKQPVDMKEILSTPAENKIATMGKLLNTFAAMATYLFLSPSQRNKMEAMMRSSFNPFFISIHADKKTLPNYVRTSPFCQSPPRSPRRRRRLAHLAAAAAAAPYSERFLRAFSSTSRIDDLVYVGKGYKICGKDEIESEISEIYTHCRRKLNNERKVLPPELHSRNVVKLTCDSSAAGGICDVYLIGSEHFWPESWREVKNVISFLKPEVVFLELCSKRLDVLKGQQKVPTIGEMFELWKNNEDPFWILHLWFHAKMSNQPYDEWPSEKFGVTYEEAMKYGVKVMLGERPDHSSNQQECSEYNEWISGEFGVAYKEAMKYGGKVILGDRPEHMMELLSIPAGNKIATMGKLLNTFAAMATLLFLSESQREKIRSMMIAFFSRRLKMKNSKLGWWPKSPRH